MEIKLFHTGYQAIPNPDVHYGRTNADFGQGFYLSSQEEFSKRWARLRKGQETILNRYLLETDGLAIKVFERDEAWFEYLFHNRNGYEDELKEYNVIVGPIANDTIYDTFGMITSGFLKKEEALQLLLLGPIYEQTVLKTNKAVEHLQFLSAEPISPEEILSYRASIKKEEEEYLSLLTKQLEKMEED